MEPDRHVHKFNKLLTPPGQSEFISRACDCGKVEARKKGREIYKLYYFLPKVINEPQE